MRVPAQAATEYHLAENEHIILIGGSKTTGGFCVTTLPLLAPSKLGHMLSECPELRDRALPEGELVRYKGRSYTWLGIEAGGVVQFTAKLLSELDLHVGSELVAIRSSDIAFTMGAKGPLWERVRLFKGEIARY